MYPVRVNWAWIWVGAVLFFGIRTVLAQETIVTGVGEGPRSATFPTARSDLLSVDRASDESRRPTAPTSSAREPQIPFGVDVPWSYQHEFHDETSVGPGFSEAYLGGVAFEVESLGLALTSTPRVEFANPTWTVDPDFVGSDAEFAVPLRSDLALGPVTLGQETSLLRTEDTEALSSSLVLEWTVSDALELMVETQAYTSDGAQVEEWSYEFSAQLAVSESLQILLEVQGTADRRFREDSHDTFVSALWGASPRSALFLSLGSVRDDNEGKNLWGAYVGLSLSL